MRKKVNIQPGDMVTWTSQSGGVAKTKNGMVIAIVPKFMGIPDYFPDITYIPRSRVKAQMVNIVYDRALVKVQRGRYAHYYAPPIGVLKKLTNE